MSFLFPKLERGSNDRRKEKIFEIIFEADTDRGKVFDVALLALILVSVALVTLESVHSFNARYHTVLVVFEGIVTALFTVEYLLRVYCVRRPWRYILSFYGLVDLLSIAPTYLGVFYPATRALASLRILRLLRIFRIFKLTQFLRGGSTILNALHRARAKIVVFLSFMTLMVVVIGSAMYVIEGQEPDTGFTDIPTSIYWAVVTLTTVGYGDIAPVTPLGKLLSSIVMIIGYGVIAVPTGFIAAEAVRSGDAFPEPQKNTQVCRSCHDPFHADGARFCKSCGFSLHREDAP